MPFNTNTQITLECARCGKPFRVKLHRSATAKYCSKACTPLGGFIPEAERFWAMVNKTESCWLWTGAVNADGYGLFRRAKTRKAMAHAHRVAWEFGYGPIPKGLSVLHDCPSGDNPACVRHLWLGTQKDNMADAARKGRMLAQAHPERVNRGESHWNSKLTNSIVEEIKKRLLSGETMYSIDKSLGLRMGACLSIKNGVTWRHIPWPC